jgi:insertion element IS1 protein InsB
MSLFKMRRMNCKICNEKSIKRGMRNTIQKYYCKSCNKFFQSVYTNKLCTAEDDRKIVRFNNEGLGISSISRLLNISKSNVLNRIRRVASCIQPPIIQERNQIYEVDELYTFIGNKKNPIYLIYAINSVTKKSIHFIIGKRTKENINQLIKVLLSLQPKMICTDRLNIYYSLIDNALHNASKYKTNHIERMNLTLRTHLKRLSRKTICFSKSICTLSYCLQLYFLFDFQSY